MHGKAAHQYDKIRDHSNSIKAYFGAGLLHYEPKMICDELDISTGNLTCYFPTKESLLEVLVEMLCKFQGKTLQSMVQEEGATSLLAVCLELAVIATISEENDIASDVFQAFYLSPLCLDVIRRNDAQRAKFIYGKYCPDWTQEQHIEAELSLTFTGEDVGNIYTYKLSEVAGDIQYMTYDETVYEITVAVTQTEDGQLKLTVQREGSGAYKFVNTYEGAPVVDIPETGDNMNQALLLGLMLSSLACLIVLTITRKRFIG